MGTGSSREKFLNPYRYVHKLLLPFYDIFYNQNILYKKLLSTLNEIFFGNRKGSPFFYATFCPLFLDGYKERGKEVKYHDLNSPLDLNRIIETLSFRHQVVAEWERRSE